jgi:hypothetical protein
MNYLNIFPSLNISYYADYLRRIGQYSNPHKLTFNISYPFYQFSPSSVLTRLFRKTQTQSQSIKMIAQPLNIKLHTTTTHNPNTCLPHKYR